MRSGERLTVRTRHLFRYKANAAYQTTDTAEGSAGGDSERRSKVRRLEMLELETCSSASGHGRVPQDSLGVSGEVLILRAVGTVRKCEPVLSDSFLVKRAR